MSDLLLPESQFTSAALVETCIVRGALEEAQTPLAVRFTSEVSPTSMYLSPLSAFSFPSLKGSDLMSLRELPPDSVCVLDFDERAVLIDCAAANRGGDSGGEGREDGGGGERDGGGGGDKSDEGGGGRPERG